MRNKYGKIVALLPIKAGDGAFKDQNFKSLHGKPLFRWILDTLLEVNDISTIVINTDARAMLAEHGVTDTDRILIRDRHALMRGDNVSMNLVFADDIATTRADTYVMTHATNPMLSAGTISAALAHYQEMHSAGQADSLFSVNTIQTRLYKEDLTPLNHDPNYLVPSQDLKPLYEENSCLYIFSSDSFAKTKTRIGEQPVMFSTPQMESIYINTADDWALAECVAMLQAVRRGQAELSRALGMIPGASVQAS